MRRARKARVMNHAAIADINAVVFVTAPLRDEMRADRQVDGRRFIAAFVLIFAACRESGSCSWLVSLRYPTLLRDLSHHPGHVAKSLYLKGWQELGGILSAACVSWEPTEIEPNCWQTSIILRVG